MKHACLKTRLSATLVAAWMVAGCANADAMSESGGKQDLSAWTPPSCEELVPTLLEKAAGSDCAAFVLAESYETDEPCLAKDMVKAARFYRQAAELGDMDAMVRLGFQYTTGIGVETDHVLARRWFKRAVLRTARQSPAERWRDIMRALGDRAVPDGLRAEVQWIESVMTSAPDERYRVAIQLRDGRGLPPDGRAALRILFSIQHDSGPGVHFEIGRGLLTGEYPFNPLGSLSDVDVPDAAEITEMGRDYLRVAVNDGHVPAMILRAQSYAEGVEGTCYPASAYELLARALFLGAEDQGVSQLLRLLEQRLTDEQKTEAKKWVRSRWSFLGPKLESAVKCP